MLTSDENEDIYQLGNYNLIQNQILQTNITRTLSKQWGELLMRPWELNQPRLAS